MISKEIWEKHCPDSNPFLNYEFFNALITSGALKNETGWNPVFIEDQDNGFIYSFSKNHSYGEYIFDWAWAEAFQKNGLQYYPKLTSMMPFTPVTISHFMMKKFDSKLATKLLIKYDKQFNEGEYSSSHFLFLEAQEISVFESQDYKIRESLQYHFFNKNYKNFEDFLSNLKAKKAKTIKKERFFPDLKINRYTGANLINRHSDQMYEFYISTILNKHSHDYLNKDFFTQIFEKMKNNLMYIEAEKNGAFVAGSLFFYDNEKLYGRYWGSTTYIENLHFELCYYQGIDFCIEKGLSVFEAGAQGEHKIARGFRPIKTFSAHKIKHPVFKSAIDNFIDAEKKQVASAIEKLSAYLPFKSNEI